jgi:hypothetical protein
MAFGDYDVFQRRFTLGRFSVVLACCTPCIEKSTSKQIYMETTTRDSRAAHAPASTSKMGLESLSARSGLESLCWADATQITRVNLERLLRCSERLADEIKTESDRRRLLTYLSVMERYWHELEAAKCSAAVLAEYRRKIEHIGDLLDDEKMLTGSGGALARSRLHNHATLTREEANSELASRLNAANRVQQELRSQLMHHVEGAALLSAADAAGTSEDHAAASAGEGAAAGAAATQLPSVPASVVAASSAVVTNSAAATAAATAAAAVAASASLGPGAGSGPAPARAAAEELPPERGGMETESLGKTLETQRQLQDEILEDLSTLVSARRPAAARTSRPASNPLLTRSGPHTRAGAQGQVAAGARGRQGRRGVAREHGGRPRPQSGEARREQRAAQGAGQVDARQHVHDVADAPRRVRPLRLHLLLHEGATFPA